MRGGVQAQKSTNDESKLRRSIEEYVGMKVELKTKSGRNKSSIYGTIEHVYPAFFLIAYENDHQAARKASCSYKEVLTGDVEVAIYNKDNQQIIISNSIEEHAC